MSRNPFAFLRRKSLVLLAGGVISVSMGGAVSAITSKNFIYETERNGFYSIHAMAMAPDDGSTAYVISWPGSVLSTSSSNCFNTGLHLPQGAEIKNVRAYYSSNSQSNFGVAIARITLATGASVFLASQTVIDDSNTRTAVTLQTLAGQSKVNNNTYAYGFGVCIGPGTYFYGARILYKYDRAGA